MKLISSPISVIPMVVQAYPQCIIVFVVGTWLSMVYKWTGIIWIQGDNNQINVSYSKVLLWLKCTMASGYV